MEQGFGSDSVPAPGSVDKSRVLTVRPLRCLVPIFPSPSSSSSPQGGPFMCIPPNGPFPPGISPFYPFSETQRTDEQNPQAPFGVTNQAMHSGFNNAIASPVPINSFRTPDAQAVTNSTHYSGAANGVTGSGRRSTRSRAAGVQSDVAVINEDGYSDSQNQSDQYLSSFSMHVIDAEDNSKSGKRRGNYQKRTRSGADIIASPVVDVDSVANSFLASLSPAVLDALRQTDGDKESVRIILIIFNLLRRRITQIEDGKDTTPGITRRPDLRAGTILMNKGFRANIKKRVGAVPGIEIGDIFFFRMELCLVGLHAPSMAGIDYMTLKVSQDDEPVAVSIVSSGGYEDNVEDGDVLIYSGQGGNIYRKDKDVMFRDQKLERGNLALEKSLRRGNEVRVIRGVKDVAHPTGKVYVYDGLYKIQQSWIEKGKSGINIFKYKLVRLPGQPEAFLMWKSIQQWRDGLASRVGLILPDLTSGAENLPVSLVNDVDDEKGPAHFTYFPSLKYLKPFNSPQTSLSCTCRGGCQPGDLNCPCIQTNGVLPYSTLGVLLSSKSLIYECGPSCLCPPNCRNRMSQAGLKVRLEVFKTKDKGWGLRSWDPIRAEAFICEYAGEAIDKSTGEEFESENEEYIFDATSISEPLPLIHGNLNESQKMPFPLVISAQNGGNVARFMNHSCIPNVHWQPVLRQTNGGSYLHIAFFAIVHIPPMKELTYDYGSVRSSNAEQRRKKCLCGSLKCQGHFP
ncbi:histone-lysine N-methyltransferase, H3 lysine-9 specific SUVH1-like [Diospyros lotus]|uniref:histone-lysine N-methyltransferase, H3 lysine-9 specific SUVH1-like n=1 Tax=Diospyros lotus TaxID=55363 RepID=UPI00225429F7|nr:histone-lysine N-methyltransferase, H3 lysine-9 specific SUVH1-like [Diospyros lotus]XP_052175124.1 histone-lysine N-methyltransferase, H3 lysine-9 specific SUVH1-like [Diospyros lotus]XP_052175125.1 histone-lysine N-methyltransferase, H3 lysine-9 specific SUVH1-like [Diospyros lotus]XP_052175127.1 histone-lysine N-methyltransferase, H3 lysine-9 specific SUVH1-like [Diospyros lotus]XP_052175128.1 histone-lysine N-methyltransferase, H3 lysine-9 specific SUVH1-like [Diospyros lotus]XP_0521751